MAARSYYDREIETRATERFAMTTDYDLIARQYRLAKRQEWRSRVETHSLMRLAGDVRGKRVLDIACGEGHFTRMLRAAGAASVVGIDISRRMVELARAQEDEHPLGVEYRVEDARRPSAIGEFDLVVSAWLLVYAHDRAELLEMCQGLARPLRPGGRLATLTTNPDLYHFDRHDYRKYGFEMRLADHAHEGAPIVWTIHLEDGDSFEIENYYLPREAFVTALTRAGFRQVEFHSLELSPKPDAPDDGDHWADLLRYPPAILIDAVKA